jgi:tight adherence protein B
VTTSQLIFVLLAGACCALSPGPGWGSYQRRRPRWGREIVPPGTRYPGRPRVSSWALALRRGPVAAETEAWDAVRLVRQLAALLEAGRSGPLLWEEALAGRTGVGARAGPGTGSSAMLVLAQSAARLGLSPGAALRRAGGGLGPVLLSGQQQRFWTNLAACLEFSEQGGAPLAGLLWRYASALEDELDAAAVRRTALAGPRSTTRLLTGLPLLALLLGVLMGIDPLGILWSEPLGWVAAATGSGLMALGRWWSSFLLRAAERDR